MATRLGYWQGWLKMLMQISVGTTNWKHGWIKDPLHPLLFGMTAVAIYYGASVLNSVQWLWLCALVLFLWLLAGDPLINTVMVLGGGYLLWHLRAQLTPVTVTASALGLILASEELGHLVVLLTVLCHWRSRWCVACPPSPLGIRQWASSPFFLLASFAVRFAQHLWIA